MEKKRLGDICEIVTGATPKTNIKEFWDGDINWITPAELTEDTYIINESLRKITTEGVEKTGLKSFPKGTVILSSRAPIGKVAIAGYEMYCNQGFKNLICSKQINNRFLYWYLKGHKEYLNSLGRGATFKEISKEIVENIEICLPTLEKQKKYADILEQCNGIIQIKKGQLRKLETLVKSRFAEMFGDIGTGIFNFGTCKLGDVARVGSSHRVFTTEFVESGIPFYRGTEIGELANGQKPSEPYCISEEHYERLANDDTKPLIGDLLMPSICNKGQVWMVDTEEPFYYKDGRVLCISPDRRVFNSKFLQYFMREKTLVEYPKMGSGSTFAEFKIFLLKNMDVLIPPREIQEQFAAFVHQVDKSKSKIQKSLEETQLLFDSLMQKYFG